MDLRGQLKIKPDRLMKDLRDLAKIGKLTTGVSRTSLSNADLEARHWLLKRMADAGLKSTIDTVGNVHGQINTDAKSVIIGSHTDSVPVGGWLDGSLGVIYGLEIARTVLEAGYENTIGIHAISFMDEEGTYLACLGSRKFCQELSDDEIADGQNPAGEQLAHALDRAGLTSNPEIFLDSNAHIAYLEAHIEQGPRLEAERKAIGIVTGIVGIRRFRLEIRGEADHAGTVPMSMRKDAGTAAIRFSHRFLETVEGCKGADSVWNVGFVNFEPGAANVVPAKAELLYEIRDLDAVVLDRMESAIHDLCETANQTGLLQYEITKTIDIMPSAMDSALSNNILDAAKDIGSPHMMMPSGAGHDAMVFARHIPSAMLFIPSIKGKSHSEAEDTSEKDIIVGCQVLAGSIEGIFST